MNLLPIPIRIWLANRDADKLLRKAGRHPHRPSLHLVQKDTAPVHQVPDYTRRPWFVILAVIAVFGVGYIAGDDYSRDTAAACESKSGARP